MLTAAIATHVVMKSVMHKVPKQNDGATQDEDIAQLLRVFSHFSGYQDAGDAVQGVKRRERRSP
jgi:hypothetical protein